MRNPLLARPRLQALALFTLVFAAYLPSLQCGFIWDDDTFLWANPLIHAADGLRRFWFTTQAPDYFPLTSSMLWLEWRLFGPDHPWGYHLINILLHAGSTILLWRVLLQLRVPAAWFAALLFGLHPVCVESVSWITERKNTLPLFLALAATLLHLRAISLSRPNFPPLKVESSKLKVSEHSSPLKPDTRHLSYSYAASFLLFTLALLAKTSVAPLPFVLALLLWWRHRPLRRQDLYPLIPLFLSAATLALTTLWFQSQRAIGDAIIRDDSLLSRLALAGRAIWFYLAKALWPFHLEFIYPRWPTLPPSLIDFFPLAALLALFITLWLTRARPWAVALLTALAAYLLLLLPILGFFNIYFMRYSLVADHWQYPALPALAALLAATLHTSISKVRSSVAGVADPGPNPAPGRSPHQAPSTKHQALRPTPPPHPDTPTLRYILLPALLLSTLFLTTWHQQDRYRNEPTFYNSLLKDAARHPAPHTPHQAPSTQHQALPLPGAWLAHNNLGLMAQNEGRLDEALAHFHAAIAAAPAFEETYNNMGVLLFENGRAADAPPWFTEALRHNPNHLQSHLNLGKTLLASGNADAALARFTIVTNLNPAFAEGFIELGRTFRQLGRLPDAVAAYTEALRLDPNSADAHNNLANVLRGTEKVDDAIAHYREAIRLGPASPEPHNNLATLLLQTGDLDAAYAEFQRALALRPDYADAHFNLARLLIQMNRPTEAAHHLHLTLQLSPSHPQAHSLLSSLPPAKTRSE